MWWNDGIVWIISYSSCRHYHFPLDIVLSELGQVVTLTQLSICSVYGICIFACGWRAEWPKQKLDLYSEMIQCIILYPKLHYSVSLFLKSHLFLSFFSSLKFLSLANIFLSMLCLPYWSNWHYSIDKRLHCYVLSRRMLLQDACLRIILLLIWSFHTCMQYI